MKTSYVRSISYLKVFLLFLLAGISLQSCSNDEDLEQTVDSVEELRGNRHNGNENRDRQVDELENDLLNQWTDKMLELERYSTGMRPNATARAFAYMHLAVYETAVPGMHDMSSTAKLLRGLEIDERVKAKNVDYELALNACYADVLNHFMINLPSDKRNEIRLFENGQEITHSRNVSNQVINESKQWGAYVANQVIEYSQTDRNAESQILEPQPRSYVPPTGPGFWSFSADPERALFPYWGSVRTFVISPNETTSIPPKSYSENPNSPYYAEMLEAYNENNDAKNGNNEKLWIAEFWSDDVENLMISPPARQVSIANQLIKIHDLNMAEALTLYLKLGFSLNDAAVSTWDQKYEHMVMRPSVYIQNLIDPSYQTNLYRLIYWPNPSFPGYPSGHSCFASAAAGLFIDKFGNRTNFTDRTHEGRTEFLGNPRSYRSFSDMAYENAFSRVPLGVHIPMDCEEGLRLGYDISDAVNDLNLKRQAL